MPVCKRGNILERWEIAPAKLTLSKSDAGRLSLVVLTLPSPKIEATSAAVSTEMFGALPSNGALMPNRSVSQC